MSSTASQREIRSRIYTEFHEQPYFIDLACISEINMTVRFILSLWHNGTQ
ncbi:hypothetical protein [Shewanella sp. UCD-KL12]|nr:hypothetical protein [Shewanella sp. UCD-KL12]